MESVRNKRLDNLCESIVEHREALNSAKRDEQGDIQAALQVMQKANITVYKHGGVALARVPGAEKLQVRLTKEHGDAGDGDLVDDSAPNGGDLADDNSGDVDGGESAGDLGDDQGIHGAAD